MALSSATLWHIQDTWELQVSQVCHLHSYQNFLVPLINKSIQLKISPITTFVSDFYLSVKSKVTSLLLLLLLDKKCMDRGISGANQILAEDSAPLAPPVDSPQQRELSPDPLASFSWLFWWPTFWFPAAAGSCFYRKALNSHCALPDQH